MLLVGNQGPDAEGEITETGGADLNDAEIDRVSTILRRKTLETFLLWRDYVFYATFMIICEKLYTPERFKEEMDKSTQTQRIRTYKDRLSQLITYKKENKRSRQSWLTALQTLEGLHAVIIEDGRIRSLAVDYFITRTIIDENQKVIFECADHNIQFLRTFIMG